jgi:succinate dehydrogenase/fumarate reductase flavoprotein subunit
VSRGGSNHAINSKLTHELGINYDVGKNFKREIDRAGGRIDQEKWSLFARKSGEAMDWLIDKMVAEGYSPTIEIGGVDPDGILSTYPGSHCFFDKKKQNEDAAGGQPLVVKTLAKCAQAAGVRIYYKTVAKQLVREKNNTGKVTAVIAKNADGKCIKFIGTKAIVLATGDFTKDREMVSKYCPEVLSLVNTKPVNYDAKFTMGGIYAGDGHKMGLWVGAAWQKIQPNAPFISAWIGTPGTYTPQPYLSFQGLSVNKNGVRYCNEDVSSAVAAFIQMSQPESKIYAIWDTSYAKHMAPWYLLGQDFRDPEKKIDDVVAKWEADIQSGRIVKANSIRELAERLELDSVTLSATADRYNNFCKKGLDEDFFKREGLLIPVEKAPFYGQVSKSPTLLLVSGGLRTNIKMQVLDKQDRVIPGLYAVGTIIGDMFANYYSFMPSGINLGATCLTFGYIAGKEIAKF